MHLSAAALRWPGSCFFGEAEAKKLEMQVGSISGLSAQLLALQGVAQDKYLSGDDFSFALDQASGSQGAKSITSTHASSSSSPKLSGGFTSTTLTAVGAVGADGRVKLFSQQPLDQEETQLANVGKLAYGNSVENFLSLAQAASPAGGAVQSASLTDQQQFTGDNGLIAGNFTTHLDLRAGTAIA